MTDNPYLPADYLDRLAEVYQPGSAAAEHFLRAGDAARCPAIAPRDGLPYKRRCTLDAGHPPEQDHQWLRRGHAIRWPVAR